VLLLLWLYVAPGLLPWLCGPWPPLYRPLVSIARAVLWQTLCCVRGKRAESARRTLGSRG
jgi:hypothetical protein